jgi:acyl-CoA thioesterase-1
LVWSRYNLLTIIAGTAIALCFLCTGCERRGEHQAQPAQHAEAKYQGIIVAMGDSLTAGLGVDENDAYPAQLERKLRRGGYNWHVVNAGISGETSSGALSRIGWVLKLKPDIVILETGANDGLRGTDPRLMRKNIEEMLHILEKNDVVVVLAGMEMLANLGKEYTGAFSAVYTDLSRKHRVILMPFFLADVAGDQSLNQQDGLHPTTAGYRIITDNIYPYVLDAIERRRGK